MLVRVQRKGFLSTHTLTVGMLNCIDILEKNIKYLNILKIKLPFDLEVHIYIYIYTFI